MKVILRTIWGLWGNIVFFSLCLLISPVFFTLLIFLGKKSSKYLIWIANKLFTSIYFFLTIIRIKNHGQEKISKNKNYIVIGNHASSIDFMLHAWASPVLFKYLSKIENTKIPVFGSLIKHITILVRRNDRSSTKNSYENLKEELIKGFSIFIYPEGTRNKTDRLLGDFYPGAFKMAIETGLPLVVSTLVGVKKVSDGKRKLDLSPGVISCFWETPIDTSAMTLEDVPKLKEEVRGLMLQRLESE